MKFSSLDEISSFVIIKAKIFFHPGSKNQAINKSWRCVGPLRLSCHSWGGGRVGRQPCLVMTGQKI